MNNISRHLQLFPRTRQRSLGPVAWPKRRLAAVLAFVLFSGTAFAQVTVGGSVYGGGALANVNGTSTVLMDQAGATVNVNVFGGGLGRLASSAVGEEGDPGYVPAQPAVAALVGGAVSVTVNNGKVIGAVFGCNDVNGTPQSTVAVTINGSNPTVVNDEVKTYAIGGVYGGGNQAHYDPTDTNNKPVVVINNCSTSVKDVFGGGNAAAVTATDVTINGGDIDRVFAGGNGVSGTPAHVGWKNTDGTPSSDVYGAGTASLLVAGGTINQVFGGSNARGNIRVGNTVTIDKNGGSCDMHLTDVFGGGNEAAGAAGTLNIVCTGGESEGITNVYGGANAADVTSGDIVLNITGGRIGNAFGGNNASGSISGAITVNVEWGNSCASNYLGNVYGGGNLAAYTGSPTVNIKNGTVSQNVYGGGKGASAVVTGAPTVTIGDLTSGNEAYVATVSGDVYGGGDLANVNGTPHVLVQKGNSVVTGDVYGGGNAADVYATDVDIAGGDIRYVFGGGHGDKASLGDGHSDKVANVTGDGGSTPGNVDIDITGGTIVKVFAGSNINGSISGDMTLDIDKSTAANAPDMKIGEVYGGGNLADGNAGTITIGCTGDLVEGEGGHVAHPENIGTTLEGIGYVYGGANQANIGTIGSPSNIALNINSGMVANVFGGNNTSGTISGSITVNVEKNDDACGWYVGNVYGGGNLAAYTGSPTVNIKNGTVSQNVYGGGKGASAVVTGAPTVTVGDETPEHSSYHAVVTGSVFGGGDAASVTEEPVVLVQKCNTEAGYVYGGGNAATVPSTDVTITGGNAIGEVYGGCYGADVTTNGTDVKILGGKIGKVFGGNNSSGAITGSISVNVNKTSTCDMIVGEVYSGGNFAPSAAGTVTIGCTGTLTADHNTHPENIGTTLEGIGYVYGGANQADITGDITLNINSGIVENVFGGNNTSGTISGSITVNVEKTDDACGWYVGNVFGGGNLAQYTGNPAVNIKNGTVSQNVYGGGKGHSENHTKGQVTGNPVVTIGDNNDSHQVTVRGSVFGGGDAGNVIGTPAVSVIEKCNTEITTAVYGGGNAADVSATNVIINGGTIGDVFGGGNGAVAPANVTGATGLAIHGGTINRVFAGGNTSGTIGTNSGVTINHTSSCAQSINEVYGGGNFAAGNAGTINIECTAKNIGDVYGGANQANIGTSDSPSNILLNITGGQINNVYGGNNTSGTIYGTITVNVAKDPTCSTFSVNNVYGGGNMAAYTGSPAVNIKNGTVSQNVYGGGKGSTAVVTGSPSVTVGDNTNDTYSAIVTGDVYGGGDAAAVSGNTSVTYNDTNVTSSVANLFGGGNAAGVTGTTTVTLTNGTVSTGLYGGCNTSGTVGGNITVNVNGGTVGSSAQLQAPSYTVANVFGGGFGASTSTSGNVEVNISGASANIYGDVYGGSALGNVNTDGNNTTTVNILNGTLHSVTDNSTGFTVYHGGNVYGGGLGDALDENKGKTFGKVEVNIGAAAGATSGPSAVTVHSGNATIGGNVYGCNNTNGSPQDNVTVNIYSTAHTDGNFVDDEGFAIANVFGGGNEANYTAEGKTATVNIYGCYNTIGRSFGGGNAAATPSVVTNIQGGHIGKVFGGGNGERGSSFGANVNGTVSLGIHGGHIGQSFGGSNQNGTISGEINIVADNNGPCGTNLIVDEFFCGGNFADIDHDLTTDILCSEGMVVRDLYGGCNQAEIHGDVVLNVHGGEFTNVYGGSKGDLASLGQGHIEKDAIITGNVTLNLYGGTMVNVYGGSNVNGTINGTITVNVIDEVGPCPLYITNIYGGSNLTSYDPTGSNVTSPIVNVVHAKYGISGNVYGGSKGEVGGNTSVISNPLVNIGYEASMPGFTTPAGYSIPASPKANVAGSVFGGGDAAEVTGNTTIFLRNRAKVFGNVYGGGNRGPVSGNTKVIVKGEHD